MTIINLFYIFINKHIDVKYTNKKRSESMQIYAQDIHVGIDNIHIMHTYNIHKPSTTATTCTIPTTTTTTTTKISIPTTYHHNNNITAPFL